MTDAIGWTHLQGLSLFVSALALAGCAITEPVAVVSEGIPGGVMRGTTTAALSGGSFSVINGTLSCGGDYNALDQSPTISIPVLCNDGRKGIVTATRDYGGTSGGGQLLPETVRSGSWQWARETRELGIACALARKFDIS
jgi:hypothetical protein